MIKMEDMHEAPLAKTDLSAATVTVQPASNRAQLLVSKWHHSLRRSNSPLVESDSIESLPSQKYKQFILTKIDLWIHEYTCILSVVMVFFPFLQGLKDIFLWAQDYKIYFLYVTTFLNQSPTYVAVFPVRWLLGTRNTNVETGVAMLAISPSDPLRESVLLAPCCEWKSC